MASKKPPVRDARFKDRDTASGRPSGESTAVGAGAGKPSSGSKARGSLPRQDAKASARVPFWRNANLMFPGVMGLLLVSAGVWFYRDQHPPPAPQPAATDQSVPAPGADAAPPHTDAAVPAADAAVPATDAAAQAETVVAAAPVAAPSEGASHGEPVEAAHPQPSSPDPRHGHFTLADATAGLAGSGPLVAEIDTSMGAFTCDLLSGEAPATVANFVGLARGTRDFWDPVAGQWARRPFYDGSIFHRVIPGFMIQGGDQLRSGTGGTGYEFADENVRGHDAAGQLCMANHGPNTNGGQFFITEAAKPHLDGSYSIFGHCRPPELVGRIARVPSASDRPVGPVFIRHVTVRRAG